MEIAKQSFANSASPDGTPWEQNSPATILHYLEVTGGNHKQDGSLSKKGQARVANKKPLANNHGKPETSKELVIMNWEASIMGSLF